MTSSISHVRNFSMYVLNKSMHTNTTASGLAGWCLRAETTLYSDDLTHEVFCRIIHARGLQSWSVASVFVIAVSAVAVEEKVAAIYLDLARIFLRFLFSLRIRFLRHLALIFEVSVWQPEELKWYWCKLLYILWIISSCMKPLIQGSTTEYNNIFGISILGLNLSQLNAGGRQ